jgi:hypothetical protein
VSDEPTEEEIDAAEVREEQYDAAIEQADEVLQELEDDGDEPDE